MLHIYRRHRVACPHRSQKYRRCQCPIYVKGTLGGVFTKMALDQTDWNAASQLIADWTAAGSIGQVLDNRSRTIADTVAEFMEDAKSRELADETLRKYRNLLEQRLLTWCQDHHYVLLTSLDLPALSKFRATWTKDSSITKYKTQERLRWFFGWCVKRKYLEDNPASGLTEVKVTTPPTEPFTVEQMEAIFTAVKSFHQGNAFGHDNRARVRAFIMLLRWTGLRIRDVATLEWSRILDGKVFLYTQKTGVPVYVPIPQSCVEAVESLPRRGRYIFWTGRGKEKTFVSNWQRSLRTVFETAGIPDGHAHRFRDTFAVNCLLAGIDLADVSILLGHRSVKTTERAYAPWVRARQVRLETALRRTWTDGESAPPATSDTPAPRPTAESAMTNQV